MCTYVISFSLNTHKHATLDYDIVLFMGLENITSGPETIVYSKQGSLVSIMLRNEIERVKGFETICWQVGERRATTLVWTEKEKTCWLLQKHKICEPRINCFLLPS